MHSYIQWNSLIRILNFSDRKDIQPDSLPTSAMSGVQLHEREFTQTIYTLVTYNISWLISYIVC